MGPSPNPLRKRMAITLVLLFLGAVFVLTMRFEIEVPDTHIEGDKKITVEIKTTTTTTTKRDTPPEPLHIPSRLAKVLGRRISLLTPDDELLRAGETDIDFLNNVTTLGNPTFSEDELYEQLTTDGFSKIPNMLSRDVAASLRKYLLSLLGAEGVKWDPNEGDNEHTIGRINKGMHAKYYKPLEKIMGDPNMIRYMKKMMPCKHSPEGSSDQFRMTQMFITINDRIKWHVDFPNQPPYENGKTTMYSNDFCQYKTIYYLQDHNLEDDSNPSALLVVPDTFSSTPHWTKCDKSNCSLARKGQIPDSSYESTTLRPAMGDLLVMDARALHAAADNSLILPRPSVGPSPRLYKYRVFLQFLWGLHKNKLTDAMQKKKDKNLVTKGFSNTIFPVKK